MNDEQQAKPAPSLDRQDPGFRAEVDQMIARVNAKCAEAGEPPVQDRERAEKAVMLGRMGERAALRRVPPHRHDRPVPPTQRPARRCV